MKLLRLSEYSCVSCTGHLVPRSLYDVSRFRFVLEVFLLTPLPAIQGRRFVLSQTSILLQRPVLAPPFWTPQQAASPVQAPPMRFSTPTVLKDR